MSAAAGEPRTGLDVRLRAVEPADLEVFFVQQIDPEANWMAAFTCEDPLDRRAFAAHWAQILAAPSNVLRSVLAGSPTALHVVGHLASFEREGQREVSYWLGREHWGRGIATRALGLFLDLLDEEFGRDVPLCARVAKDNAASLRVLEKCGFAICGEDRGFAQARAAEVEELVLRLGPRAGAR